MELKNAEIDVGQILLKLQYCNILLAGVDLVVLIGAYLLELFQLSNLGYVRVQEYSHKYMSW